MTMPWNQQAETNAPKPAQGDDAELAMIPRWSIVLAIVVFAATQYLFHGILPHHKAELLPWRLLMGYSTGTAFASYVLLVGYVSRDVKRRNMSAPLWLLIVILMPGGLTYSAVSFTSCCASLFCRAVRIARRRLRRRITSARSASSKWLLCAASAFAGCRSRTFYCTQCGHDLAEDHAPARLRAYSD